MQQLSVVKKRKNQHRSFFLLIFFLPKYNLNQDDNVFAPLWHVLMIKPTFENEKVVHKKGAGFVPLQRFVPYPNLLATENKGRSVSHFHVCGRLKSPFISN